ncbi:MAG: type II toxin-antitoxin system VapC family toxin [Microbacterium sp.]
MHIYLDSSALVKRVSAEEWQPQFRAALAAAVDAGAILTASALARVEVSRALRTKIDAESLDVLTRAYREAMDGIGIAPMTAPILESARIIGPPVLRSLDAIHLATAIALGVDEVWTYDDRMAVVTEEMGIPARMPGRVVS